jgi:hypothetical protein
LRDAVQHLALLGLGEQAPVPVEVVKDEQFLETCAAAAAFAFAFACLVACVHDEGLR